MSNINVWDTEQDGTSGDEEEVRLRNVHKKDGFLTSFDGDEELMAVKHIIELIDKMDNGDVVIITKDVF